MAIKQMTTKKLVLAALFAALCCAATMSVRIPTPGTGGYIHPGDAVVILTGIFLDPVTALFAAGIGSCMADLLGGYFIYVPVTFTIKGLVAFFVGTVYHARIAKEHHSYLTVALCGFIDVGLVAGGYFLWETVLYGTAAALAGIPANVVQGGSGLVIATVLYPLLKRPMQMAFTQ